MPTIKATAVHVPGERSPWDRSWDCDAWRVTLTTDTGRTMTLSYYTGNGLRTACYPTKRPRGAVEVDDQAAKLKAIKAKKAHSFANLNAYAVPPTTGDVLESLASDAAIIETCADVYEYMHETGMTTATVEELHHHADAYRATVEQTARLRDLLGPEGLNALMYDAPGGGWSSVTDPAVTVTPKENAR